MPRQMSQSKKRSTYNNNNTVRQTLQTKQPVVVKYYLNKKHDIKAAVEALLLSNTLTYSSSIFAIMPASDDENDESISGSFSSTIGIQLSDSYARRKKWYESGSDMGCKRPTSNSLIPYEQENTIFQLVLNAVNQLESHTLIGPRITNKLCQITTPYKVTHKLCQMTTPCEVTNKLCQITTPVDITKEEYYIRPSNDDRHRHRRHTRFYEESSKNVNNKLCQVRIPPEVINRQNFVAGTDTTLDRPCCCVIRKPMERIADKPCCCVNTYFTESIQNCSKRIVPTESHLISPVLIKTDFSQEDFKANQNSFLEPSNKPFSTISASLISPDNEDYDCDPIFDINRRYIYNTPLPELEGNQGFTLQSCQCTPEKLRLLLEQVLAEKSLNKMNVCCGSSVEFSRLPKRTRFIDIKCSGCFQPQHIIKRNNFKANISFDCDCSNLCTHEGHIIQKIAPSTLLCLEDPVNNGVQGHAVSTKQSKQLREFFGDYSVIKARDTHSQAGKQRRRSIPVATDTDYRHVARRSPPFNSFKNHENISPKKNNEIKPNLIQTMSGLKYPLLQPSQIPKLNVGTDIRRKMNFGCPPSRPLKHYDNISLGSSTNDQIKSNLIRTLSGFKYPQKQLFHPQRPRSKVTFEDFLKHCANMHTTSLLREIPPPGINNSVNKPLNYGERHRRIAHIPLYASPQKLTVRKANEDPRQGLRLYMSGKTSESKMLSRINSSQQYIMYT